MITYWYKVYDIDIDVHHNVITCTITISGKEWSERYDTEVCRTSNRDVASNKALISDGSSENFSFDQYYKPIVLYIFSTLSPSYRLETKNVGDKLKLFKLITRSSLYVFLWQTMIKISKWVSRLDTIIIIIKEHREISIRDDNNL